MVAKTYILFDQLTGKRHLFTATIHKVHNDWMELKDLKKDGRLVFTPTTVPAALRKKDDLSEVEPAIYPVKVRTHSASLPRMPAIPFYFDGFPIMFRATVKKTKAKSKVPKRLLIDGHIYLTNFHQTTFEDEHNLPPAESIKNVHTENGKTIETFEYIDYELRIYRKNEKDRATGKTIDTVDLKDISDEFIKDFRKQNGLDVK